MRKIINQASVIYAITSLLSSNILDGSNVTKFVHHFNVEEIILSCVAMFHKIQSVNIYLLIYPSIYFVYVNKKPQRYLLLQILNTLNTSFY